MFEITNHMASEPLDLQVMEENLEQAQSTRRSIFSPMRQEIMMLRNKNAELHEQVRHLSPELCHALPILCALLCAFPILYALLRSSSSARSERDDYDEQNGNRPANSLHGEVASLRNQNAELQERNDFVQIQHKKFLKEIKKLKHEVKKLCHQNAKFQDTNEFLQRANNMDVVQTKKLQHEIARLCNQIAVLKNELQGARDVNDPISRDTMHKLEETFDLHQETAKLRNEKTEVQEKLRNTTDDNVATNIDEELPKQKAIIQVCKKAKKDFLHRQEKVEATNICSNELPSQPLDYFGGNYPNLIVQNHDLIVISPNCKSLVMENTYLEKKIKRLEKKLKKVSGFNREMEFGPKLAIMVSDDTSPEESRWKYYKKMIL